MNFDQLKCLGRAGMYISSHSYEHHWLDSVSPEAQESEIESSLRFLGELGCDLQQWAFNYPYGAHNESLVSLLKASGAEFGLTTKVGIADLESEDPLLLPRLDTNDLPKDGKSNPNEWTLRVIG
jgi:peptidoglycan/xylan/chitin deacetylase (PgdA/CDA1 family)